MKVIRDFRCIDKTCGVYTEKFIDRDTETVECLECCGPATKTLSAPAFHLDQSFPGKALKWAKDHEQGAKNPSKAHKHY